MVMSQNDVYMLVTSSKDYEDNLLEGIEDRSPDITYVRKCAKNILKFILNSPAMNRKQLSHTEIDRSE